MKWKCIICSLCILLTGLVGISAGAEENENYIVYLKPMLKAQSVAATAKSDFMVVDKDELDRLLSQGRVSYYEPDCEVKLFDDFSGSGDTGQWNLDMIVINKAWDIGCFGNEVRIAVIDSGVYEHPDLKNNLLLKEGKEYIAHNYIDGSTDTTDKIGHGTYVAGIIAAEANGEYITGIANRAKIVPLKCFEDGVTTTASMVAYAIYDAVDECKCDVINMSFGMEEASTNRTLQLAVQYAIKSGCILIASAGNDGDKSYYDRIYYPAKYDGVIGVGSVDSQRNLSYFSQRNITVDFVAPGSNIDSLAIPKFTDKSGTSFAAPHIAALAAVAKCIDKSITASEFENILKDTATDLGQAGYDTSFGYGLVNAEAMIDKMLENTDYFISPVAVNGENTDVRIYNNTDSDLSAIAIAAEYENNIFKGLNKTELNLKPKEAVTLSGGKQNNVKFMLWSGFDSLAPLSQYREYTKQ